MEKSKRLSLDHYYLDDIKVAPNQEFHDNDDASPIQPLVSVDYHSFVHATDAERFAMSLTIRSEDPPATEHPLRFSLTIVGYFKVEEAIAEGQIPPERAVNALTILYGIARGYLGTAAGWFHHLLVLPTVYFSDVIQDRIAAAKREEIPESAPLQIESGKPISV